MFVSRVYLCLGVYAYIDCLIHDICPWYKLVPRSILEFYSSSFTCSIVKVNRSMRKIVSGLVYLSKLKAGRKIHHSFHANIICNQDCLPPSCGYSRASTRFCDRYISSSESFIFPRQAFSSHPFQPTIAHDVKLPAKDLVDDVAQVQCKNLGEQSSIPSLPCSESVLGDSSQDSSRSLSVDEARKLLKLVKLEDFKKRMHSIRKHCMPLMEVMQLCKQMGTAINDAEAEEIVKSLDEAGIVLVFRGNVFLQPRKVAEALSQAMPFPLTLSDSAMKEEFVKLQREKEEIDRVAHKQVRHFLWAAFAALVAQSAIFFRLTFWELSWDVMEPIAIFATSTGLLAGFFFFVITKRDPSYFGFMDTLFSSKQRKLMKQRNFDLEMFRELEDMSSC
ncbi:hypothetical protein KP509_10G043400 [Ceratopteris richardii]|uniref:Calcium uniporter protein C-terminal domain-containing protein n=1 Tax=Ceratopteris richardii TaxID=49495 RepID=A0A8T2TVC0_CERRI|nr:hypothetical protein KP509_10G043400 [Ceratopteris richardii]